MKTTIEQKRHTLAHLLASAVLELYPDALNTIGPAIENGFYYDFDFKKPIGEEEIEKIEKLMKNHLKKWHEFTHKEVSAKEAKEIFKNNPYKTELINDLEKTDEKITLYTCGDFTDLCRGGHAENPSKEIVDKSWKLQRIAGAYWRGDEKNKMLTRIYGLAFETEAELTEYENKIEEAKKRDHKKLGKELDLFTFSELVGPGLPLWTPKGTLVRNLLDTFVWQLRKKVDYERVEIPHITKKDLYVTSGHWDKFQNELFKITTREGHLFAMKPMNCPHHTQIYKRRQWSYKELPQRYANTTACYRDEQTGELSGLSRVRSFAQDDAHVFCRQSQVKEEFLKIWDIIQTFYGSFGFKLKVRLSLHDPKHPENYLGDKERWEKAENALREIAEEKKADFFESQGEAAFYGPKIDFMAKDSIGREWQVATIQLDMNMPERFDLDCINEKGEKERIVMIHAAIMGSIERFLSILIEHTAGNFPLWLSPVQVAVIPVSEKFVSGAKEIYEKMKAKDIRVSLDDSNESLGKKIRASKAEKTPYYIVVGEKEISSQKFNLENRAGEKIEGLSYDQIEEKLLKEIAEKK
jgi:threonyl-tRNA synthetase